MKNLFDGNTAHAVIDMYENTLNGQVCSFGNSVIGLGNFVCLADNKKTCIIKEILIESPLKTTFNSYYTIKYYNKTPKKYEKYIY